MTVCIDVTDKRVLSLFIVPFEREIFVIDMSRKFKLVAKREYFLHFGISFHKQRSLNP